MPRPATDRQRVTMAAFAVLSLAAAGLGFRALNGAKAAAAGRVPATDLATLATFLGPLDDSASLAEIRSGTMVVDRDPFGSTTQAAPAPGRSSGAAPSRPKTGGSQQWVVSSILFEDNRRSAIVNNAWVGVGDPLGNGARVTAIERKYVVVTDANGNRHVVSIRGGAE